MLMELASIQFIIANNDVALFHIALPMIAAKDG